MDLLKLLEDVIEAAAHEKYKKQCREKPVKPANVGIFPGKNVGEFI